MQEWLCEELRGAGDTQPGDTQPENTQPEDTAGQIPVLLDGARILVAATGTTAPGEYLAELADQLLETGLPASEPAS